MKKGLLLLVFLAILQYLPAQMGIRMGNQWMQAPGWTQSFQEHFKVPIHNPFQPNFYFGADVKLASKKFGFAISPEFAHSRYKIVGLRDNPEISPSSFFRDDYRVSFLNFDLNADFYLLQFRTSCRGATFSKSGNWLKKGLFLRIGTGASIIKKNSFSSDFFDPFNSLSSFSSPPTSSVNGKILTGLGLDVGITNFLTVTPMLTISKYSTVAWEDFKDITFNYNYPYAPIQQITVYSQIYHTFIGFRLGFHFR